MFDRQLQCDSRIDRGLLLDSYFFILLLLTGDLWFLPRNTFATFVRLIHLALIVLFVLIYVPKHTQRKLRNPLLVGALVLYWIVNYLNVPGVSFLSILNIVILIYYCTSGTMTQVTTYQLFWRLFVFISFFGFVIYIGYILGLPPLSIEDFYEDDSNNCYYNYGLSIILVNKVGSAFRSCGLFNEPGLMGTLSALLLIAEHYDFRKIGNWMVLLGGIVSFSLAFWLILFCGIFLNALLNRSRKSIAIIILLIIGFGYLHTIETNNPNLEKLIMRTEIVDNGRISGDTRTSDEFDKYYENFKKNPRKLLFGTSLDSSLVPSSYKRYVVQYGLLLTLAIFVPLFISIIIIAKRRAWAYILISCFIISMYQRPLVFQLSYFVILIGGIQSMSFSKTNTKGVQLILK